MEEKTLFIPVLLGTAREDRESENVARFVHAKLKNRDSIETELVDVRDIPYQKTTPPWGAGGANEEPTQWQETASRADAFVIVTPEYNHGYPGELKLALDSLYDEYKRKPVGLCGVSAGGLGGARVVEHIKPVLIEFSMVPTRNAAYFSKVKELFDAEGNITNPEPHQKQITNMCDELCALASALSADSKHARI